MLVYLAGDARPHRGARALRPRVPRLDGDPRQGGRPQPHDQPEEPGDRAAGARPSETIDARLLGAYQWALVPTGQPIEIQATKVEGQATSLAERVSRRLGNDGALAVQHAAPAIRHQLDTTAAKLWADGHVTVGALWRLYAEYPYMPRLRDRSVLDAGLAGAQLLWEQEGFALADGYDEASGKLPRTGPADRRRRQVAIIDSTLIVRPEVAKAQRAAELTEAPADGSQSDGAGSESGTDLRTEPRAAGSRRSRRASSDAPLLRHQAAAVGPPRVGLQEARSTRCSGRSRRRPASTLTVTVEIEAAAAGRLRRSQDPDGVRERDHAEIRAERLRSRVAGRPTASYTDGRGAMSKDEREQLKVLVDEALGLARAADEIVGGRDQTQQTALDDVERLSSRAIQVSREGRVAWRVVPLDA